MSVNETANLQTAWPDHGRSACIAASTLIFDACVWILPAEIIIDQMPELYGERESYAHIDCDSLVSLNRLVTDVQKTVFAFSDAHRLAN